MNRIVAAALVVGALVFVAAGPSQARPAGHQQGSGGGRSAGGHSGGHVAGQRAFRGHPAVVAPRPHVFAGHREFRHREFHRGGHARVFVGVTPFVVGPAYAYGWAPAPVEPYAPPAYAAPPPSYWYYCPSAGAYYPDVPACPEPWVPVPSQ
jgi:hypothetical protein